MIFVRKYAKAILEADKARFSANVSADRYIYESLKNIEW
jgi:hypothetical protein